MKSPYFTEEHHVFRAAVRQLIERDVVENIVQWEKDEHIPHSVWSLLGKNSLLGINFGTEYGGSNADFFYSVIFLEEIAQGTSGGFSAAISSHQYQALAYLDRYGSDTLKDSYLRPGINGIKIGGLAITEPDTGSDVASIETIAQRDGDYYLVSGNKTFITNGVNGHFLVTAVKTDTSASSDGISLLVIDTNLDGVHSRKLDKLGWHTADTAIVAFDRVKVPVKNLIGEENKGFYCMMECFQLERLAAAVIATASAQYCLDITLDYIKKRSAFKRSLSRYQVIRHEISEMLMEVEASRQLNYHAAWLLDQYQPAVKECTMAKLKASELASKVADTCLQFFGGYGYMADYEVSRIFRDVRAGRLVGGTTQIMREILSKLMIDNVDYSGRLVSQIVSEDIDYDISSLIVSIPAPVTPEPVAAPPQPPVEAPPVPETPPVEKPPLEEHTVLQTPNVDDSLSAKTEALEAIFSNIEPEDQPAEQAPAAENNGPAKPPKDEISDFSEELDRAVLNRQAREALEKKPDLKTEEFRNIDDILKDLPPPVDSEPNDEVSGFQDELNRVIDGEVPTSTARSSEPQNDMAAESKPDAPQDDLEQFVSSSRSESSLNGFSKTPGRDDLVDSQATETSGSTNSRTGSASSPIETGASPREDKALTIDDIFNGMPGRFRHDKSNDYETVFHFKISGASGGEFTVIIRAGQCVVQKGLMGHPNCVVESSAQTYIDIELGKTNPQVAFMMGKIKVSNVPQMMQFVTMFKKLQA